MSKWYVITPDNTRIAGPFDDVTDIPVEYAVGTEYDVEVEW